MNSTDLLDDLRFVLPGIPVEAAAASDQQTIAIPSHSILDVCRALHDRRGFIFLADITAVDWWPRAPRFEVVYHLASAGDRLRVKVQLPATAAVLPTVQTVWPGANWLEREVWDLFGVVFEGHNDLRRLLMPEDWEGHPLRKDFPVQITLKPRSTEPLQLSEDDFRRNLEADKAARAREGR